MRFQNHINEGRAIITPVLKSSYTRQDRFSKNDAEKLSKEVAKVVDKDTKAEIGLESPISTGRPYVRLTRKDKNYESVSSAIGDAIGKARFSITDSTTGDGGTWMVFFTTD